MFIWVKQMCTQSQADTQRAAKGKKGNVLTAAYFSTFKTYMPFLGVQLPFLSLLL